MYASNPKINIIQQRLQTAVNFITDYLHTWRIKLNAGKCESILFRKPIQRATYDTKRNWKQFAIQINNTTIEQKPLVKYLGINIDRLAYLNEHINIQLTKARRAFISNKKIFCSWYISSNVKRICYQALVRPILTYGCPIWFNISPSYMEKLRIFERRCIRHCSGKFRKPNTQHTHYFSNQSQYKQFKSNRIDLHIIQLIRNHILRSTSNHTNSLIYGPYHTDERILQNSIKINYIPGPETFILLDMIGYIQDANQTPLIYHIMRRPNEKGFDSTKFSNPGNYLRFSTAQKKTDESKFVAEKWKYWWLRET